jgi:cell wall-associated NlpC family hydrolase
MKKQSVLLAPKKTSQLKVKGKKTGIKWSSTNPKVVKVSASGKVTALKTGNAVIKAKIGDTLLGCVVSVASQSKCKAVKQAIHIANTSQYSQAKRMQKGYYDCSSLVWRAYKSAGISLASSSYAPVAADLGKWCVQKKKTVKGGLSYKNVQKMKLNAGDLLFKDGENNGRFRGIYHVEMITGYICYGFDSKGKPLLELTWASRDPGYGGYGYKLVGRP